MCGVRSVRLWVYLLLDFAYWLNLKSDIDVVSINRAIIGLDHVKMSSDVGVGVSLSSFTIDWISARQNGQCCSCDAQVIQKPLQMEIFDEIKRLEFYAYQIQFVPIAIMGT